MKFISYIFSEYFSIMNFSIITKIILLVLCVFYLYAIYREIAIEHKRLKSKRNELLNGILAFIVGSIAFLVAALIYKYIIYTIVTFVIYAMELHIYIPYDEVGCLFLLGSFMFYSYRIFIQENPRSTATGHSYNSGYRSKISDYELEESREYEWIQEYNTKSSIDELSKQIDQDMANMLEIQERESRRQEKIINSMVEKEKKDLWKW